MLTIKFKMLRLSRVLPLLNSHDAVCGSAAVRFATINRREIHGVTRARKLNALRTLTQHILANSGSYASVRFASNVVSPIKGAVVGAEVPPVVEALQTEATQLPSEVQSVNAADQVVLSPDVAEKTIIDLNDIPAPPEMPQGLEDQMAQVLNAAGEPTFSSIGLGGWSPVGIVQNCMEYLHISMDLPWWAAIAVGTLVVRTLIFPLVIVSQKNAAKMNNHMPQLQLLQLKMSEARQTGNAIDSARYAQEMMQFMKEKQLNPFKNMVVPLAQAPLFISFFMGLRGMANAPVDSLREGGMLWFTDLTLSDPTFLLPLITSATLYLTIEIGTDSARLSSQNLQTMKYVLRAIPVIIFPFTMNFPAAILTYWACSNFISLGQVSLLRIPAVRDYFKIDKLVSHAPETLPVKRKGFVEGVKESWQNMKITKEIDDRQRLDEIRFAKAGKGPIIKTFKHDPTKQSEAKSAPTVETKKDPPVIHAKKNQ